MKRSFIILAVGAVALAPSMAAARPGVAPPISATSPTSNGATNGVGYTHLNGPATTGQPGASCEITPNTPGRSATAPGSAFNPNGTAGSVYAGEQPQNSRNTASVSQYDSACLHQPN